MHLSVKYRIPLLIIVIILSTLLLISLLQKTYIEPPTKNMEITPKESEDLTVFLPPPKLTGEMSVEEAIAKRRSIRTYTEEPLTIEELSQLLWAAQGITDSASGKRAAPSAGMTYPLEIYVVVGEDSLMELADGVYHYNPHQHSITKVLSGDVRETLSKAALGQTWIRDAPITIVVAAIYERTTNRYGDRGIRYVHMEAGHVGQNIYLQATAINLGTVVVGAFNDQEVQEILKLPEEQKPLYLIPVGHPKT